MTSIERSGVEVQARKSWQIQDYGEALGKVRDTILGARVSVK